MKGLETNYDEMRMDIVSCLWEQNPLSIDDVAAMVAGQIGQLTPMDEETADLFKQLAKKMMKGIE
ncbi:MULTISPECIES: hypothetical protein [Campylobacter]|uniref:hypothetical protein n=1 Tax=Campylobacter TaxID=194 RepID=UPI00093154CC|nr:MULTISPECIES: hypothetical protein [Campylobacter]